jgi:hypothetical protein
MSKYKWVSAWKGWGFRLTYAICGYFDSRPEIHICLIYGHFVFRMPWRSKGWEDECDPPEWGIAAHHQTFWIYRGGKGNGNGGNKWWTIYAPWQWSWVRTSYLLNYKKGINPNPPGLATSKRNKWYWEDEVTSHRIKDRYEKTFQDRIWKETHPYTYTLKRGEVQHRTATITIEEREWRLYWFKWLPLIKKVSRSINIEFSGEVGEQTGTWKGGCIGCSYSLLPGETPLQCLRRMEKERKF